MISNNNFSNNCDENWFLTCKNSSLKCKDCGAYSTTSSKPILYQPTMSGINEKRTVANHPATARQRKNKPVKDEIKSKQVKKGFKQEKILADFMNNAIKQSLQSGALLGDGDLHALESLVKIDSKLRIKKQSFSVSWQEYSEGKAQNINAWAITINKDNKEHTNVFMTLELFCQLLAIAQKNEL